MAVPPGNNADRFLRPLMSNSRVASLLSALGNSAQLHIVGGTVRDALLGIEPKDLDFACALLPEQIIVALESAGIRTIPTGLKHQTVTALPAEELPAVEITSFRSAGMSPAGGVSAGCSIEEDLRYRDFTINAIAYSLASCELVDPNEGAQDLQMRVIRAVGDASARFREDPLRIVRMVRFSCQEDFSVDPLTFERARPFVIALPQVSIERIRDEFSKILISDRPDHGFARLADLGILQHFLPEVAAFLNYEQNRFHKADLFHHTMEVVCRVQKDLILRWAALLHDVGKPKTLSTDAEGERHFFKHETVGASMTRDILERLRYSHDFVNSVETLVRTHMRPLNAGPGGLRRLLRDTAELYPQWRELKWADSSACKIDPELVDEQLADFDRVIEEVRRGPDVRKLRDLAINGNDLLSLGEPAGPLIGIILRALHEMVLDNPELNTKEALLRLVPEIKTQDRNKDA